MPIAEDQAFSDFQTMTTVQAHNRRTSLWAPDEVTATETEHTGRRRRLGHYEDDGEVIDALGDWKPPSLRTPRP